MLHRLNHVRTVGFNAVAGCGRGFGTSRFLRFHPGKHRAPTNSNNISYRLDTKTTAKRRRLTPIERTDNIVVGEVTTKAKGESLRSLAGRDALDAQKEGGVGRQHVGIGRTAAEQEIMAAEGLCFNEDDGRATDFTDETFISGESAGAMEAASQPGTTERKPRSVDHYEERGVQGLPRGFMLTLRSLSNVRDVQSFLAENIPRGTSPATDALIRATAVIHGSLLVRQGLAPPDALQALVASSRVFEKLADLPTDVASVNVPPTTFYNLVTAVAVHGLKLPDTHPVTLLARSNLPTKLSSSGFHMGPLLYIMRHVRLPSALEQNVWHTMITTYKPLVARIVENKFQLLREKELWALYLKGSPEQMVRVQTSVPGLRKDDPDYRRKVQEYRNDVERHTAAFQRLTVIDRIERFLSEFNVYLTEYFHSNAWRSHSMFSDTSNGTPVRNDVDGTALSSSLRNHLRLTLEAGIVDSRLMNYLMSREALINGPKPQKPWLENLHLANYLPQAETMRGFLQIAEGRRIVERIISQNNSPQPLPRHLVMSPDQASVALHFWERHYNVKGGHEFLHSIVVATMRLQFENMRGNLLHVQHICDSILRGTKDLGDIPLRRIPRDEVLSRLVSNTNWGGVRNAPDEFEQLTGSADLAKSDGTGSRLDLQTLRPSMDTLEADRAGFLFSMNRTLHDCLDMNARYLLFRTSESPSSSGTPLSVIKDLSLYQKDEIPEKTRGTQEFWDTAFGRFCSPSELMQNLSTFMEASLQGSRVTSMKTHLEVNQRIEQALLAYLRDKWMDKQLRNYEPYLFTWAGPRKTVRNVKPGRLRLEGLHSIAAGMFSTGYLSREMCMELVGELASDACLVEDDNDRAKTLHTAAICCTPWRQASLLKDDQAREQLARVLERCDIDAEAFFKSRFRWKATEGSEGRHNFTTALLRAAYDKQVNAISPGTKRTAAWMSSRNLLQKSLPFYPYMTTLQRNIVRNMQQKSEGLLFNVGPMEPFRHSLYKFADTEVGQHTIYIDTMATGHFFVEDGEKLRKNALWDVLSAEEEAGLVRIQSSRLLTVYGPKYGSAARREMLRRTVLEHQSKRNEHQSQMGLLPETKINQ
eukprot:Clim_evm9s18 gene=Clim_evmTU9s18